MACREGDDSKPSDAAITMSLLVSLPPESTVSPLLPLQNVIVHDQGDVAGDDGGGKKEVNASGKEKRRDREKVMFRSFLFEDYAWRVYHERLVTSSPKDPLDRFHIADT